VRFSADVNKIEVFTSQTNDEANV